MYNQVELKEPWCRGAKPVVDIGVLNPDEFRGSKETSHGFVRMLEESGHQFDIIDTYMDFDSYKVLVLPDCITVDDRLKEKIQRYLSNGGKLLASFESGMNPEKTQFALMQLGVECLGPGPIAPDGLPARGRKFDRCNYADYILPKGAVGKGLPETEHVMYTRCVDVSALPGSEILAPVILSVFDRTYQHFSSHNQSPSSGRVGSAGIVRSGNTIYFAHKIFELYAQYATRWTKNLFVNALEMLLPEPVLRHDGPSTLVATVNAQEKENRWVVHLLHYIPLRRATELEIIEDVIPLNEVKVSLRAPKPVKDVACRPQPYTSLDFWQTGSYIEFVVPRIEGHQMIEIAFE
ncbi:MAG: beta-galactosidase trimerization domain-containing protein [Chloroflexi bacterium]|nr:beta-galactosidase trimerization domain-containing protein [Chloroflexota bacterium]